MTVADERNFFNIETGVTEDAPREVAPQNFDYSEFKDAPSENNVLAVLAGMAQEQKAAEALVAKLTEDLAIAKEALTLISEKKIPEFMDKCEMSEYKTKDGLEVTILENIRGSIPKANEVKAFAWLEDNNSGRLIKRVVTVEFGKDEEAWAKKFAADMAKRKKPLNASTKRSVHPQTLQAYIREQLEKGVKVPMDIFGVYRQRVAKVVVK